jgi:molybdate transport system substrate-binding protein
MFCATNRRDIDFGVHGISFRMPCAPHSTLTLSMAASLREAMAEVEASYKQLHPGVDFRDNFGSSGTQEMQIEQGAPVDVFLSAAAKPMETLESRGLIIAGTRRALLRGSLVLIAPRDSPLTGFEGLQDPSIRTIALDDPASVPAGQYGRQTLASLHMLDKLNTKLVMAKDVRQVLAYVESCNADAGLVYATDALTSSKVRVVATAPESAHDAIVYPVAVVKGRTDEALARQFVEFLATPVAQAIFEKHGFIRATR